MNLSQHFGVGKANASAKSPRKARSAVNRLQWQFGEVLDLSESGMCVRVAVGAVPSVSSLQRFSLRSGSTKIEVLGRIMWLGNHRRGSSSLHAGVQFVDLSPEQANAILHALRHGQLPANGAKQSPPPCIEAHVEVEDLYAVLGVARNVSTEDLKAAFRALAQVLHPDRSPDPAAHARFTLVHKSYAVLKDPVKRSRYDLLLSRQAA